MAQDQMAQGLKNFTRQFPREAQMAKIEIQKVIAEGGAPDPDEIEEIIEIAKDLQANPSSWARLRPELIEAGMPEDMIPPVNASKVQIAQIVGILLLTVQLIGDGPDNQPEQGQPVQPQSAVLINQGV